MLRDTKTKTTRILGKVLVFLLLGSLNVNAINPTGLAYIPNEGQWHKDVAYRAQLSHGRFFLEKHGFTYSFLAEDDLAEMHYRKALSGSVKAHALKVRFVGANAEPRLKGNHKTGTQYNFYMGADSSRWQAGLPAYQQVTYKGLYNGIDLEVTSRGNKIKYNFHVAAGYQPHEIQLAYKGAEDLHLDKSGNLVVQTSVNQYREMAPKAYQVIDGQRKTVQCHYKLEGDQLSFVLPEGYNDNAPLTIDPEVIFSTYSGSPSDNFGYSATFDKAGHGYSAGTVFGSNFPITTGAYQVSWKGGTSSPWFRTGGARDVGILKYNESGTSVKYVTYLGGTKNEDPHSMIVNSDQELLIFGNTASGDFPVTNNAYDPSYNGNYDIYVSKLSADGSRLKASTYVGGDSLDGLNGRQYPQGNVADLGWNYGDMFRGEVIVDSQDRVLIATTTRSYQSFPVTNNSFQQTFGGGKQDGCIFRLSADLQTLQRSSFVGGEADDAAYSLTLANDQSILLTGGTTSDNLNFPVNGYQQQNKGGKADAMLLRIQPNLKTVDAATFFGTNRYDQSYFVQTDQQGNVYVTGQTTSHQFPTKMAAYQVDSGKQFISKFDQQLNNLKLSATFGSGDRPNPDLSPSAFLVDTCGKIYFAGWGGNPNFKGNPDNLPITQDAFDSTTKSSDFYLAVFAKNMDSLLYGTYYGGNQSEEHVDGGTSRFDKGGTIYLAICAGCDGNSDLPTTKNAYSRKNASKNCNNALLKIKLKVKTVTAGFKSSSPICYQKAVQFQNQSQLADSFIWTFGDGDTAFSQSPSHIYDKPGTYKVRQIAINPSKCYYSDTIRKSIVVYEAGNKAVNIDTGSCKGLRQFQYSGTYGSQYAWDFGDGTLVNGNNASVKHYYRDTGTYKVTLIVNPGTACADTIRDKVQVSNTLNSGFSYKEISCQRKVRFQSKAPDEVSNLWKWGDGRQTSQVSDTIHKYSGSRNYTVKHILKPGSFCADTTVKKIDLSGKSTDAIDIPNVFTPNNDGVNDHFTVEGLDTCTQYEIFIYNRWGAEVYHNTGKKVKWDGSDQGNGNPLSSGTYFFKLVGPGGYHEEGTVQIIR